MTGITLIGYRNSESPVKHRSLLIINKGKYIMPTLLLIIVIIVIVAIIILWVISVQRRLVLLDENINNAMSQIGVQLSNCFDVLMALMSLVKSYAGHECEILIETIKSGRSMITAKSIPDDVMCQKEIITGALSGIAGITGQHPEMKANLMYIKTMDAVQIYENMVRNSLLIYNNSVAKFNSEIRMFPVSVLAWILGFRIRGYLSE